MPEDYNPQDYWERRLRERDPLSSVGHRSYSDRYNVWLYRAQEAALGRLLHNIDVELRGLSVLDVGSGTGYWLTWYKGQGAGRITAVELSPSAATRLRARYPDVTVIQGDVSAPPRSRFPSPIW
jgi:cyclopropane fatty-acyl-phospholipid synthase-like methyltransferase